MANCKFFLCVQSIRIRSKEFSVTFFMKIILALIQFKQEQISPDLEYARSLNTDLIIALIHWGLNM